MFARSADRLRHDPERRLRKMDASHSPNIGTREALAGPLEEAARAE